MFCTSLIVLNSLKSALISANCSIYCLTWLWILLLSLEKSTYYLSSSIVLSFSTQIFCNSSISAFLAFSIVSFSFCCDSLNDYRSRVIFLNIWLYWASVFLHFSKSLLKSLTIAYFLLSSNLSDLMVSCGSSLVSVVSPSVFGWFYASYL